MTKAMARPAHELSQAVGAAIAIVAAHDHRSVDPASVVTFTFKCGEVHAEFLTAVVGLEVRLLDFDADCEEIWADVDRQLSKWHEEIWSDYELVEAA